MSSSCHCCSCRSACSLSATAAGNSRARSDAIERCRDLDVPTACVPPVRTALARLVGLQVLASAFPSAEGRHEGAGARTGHPDAWSSRSVAPEPCCGCVGPARSRLPRRPAVKRTSSGCRARGGPHDRRCVLASSNRLPLRLAFRHRCQGMIGYVVFGVSAAVAAGLLGYWWVVRRAGRRSSGGRRW
jgi:hypothetical protein